MAFDKLIDSAKFDAAMAATADAIRAKTKKTADIPWNETTGFASAVSEITPKVQSKTATPSTSAQTIKPDSGYDALSEVTVNAMPAATQATPSISVDSAGKITASVKQEAGYVAGGTKSATKQLTVQAAKTVTPSTSDQTAVASGVYTTGAVTVKGDANLKAANIAKGVSIFGVSGTHKAGFDVATGTITIAENGEMISVIDLDFTPTNLILYFDVYTNGSAASSGQGAPTSASYWKQIANADYRGALLFLEYGNKGNRTAVLGSDTYGGEGYILCSNRSTLSTTDFSVTFVSSGFGVSSTYLAAGTYRYIATNA